MSSKAFDGANFGLFTGDDPHMKRKNQLAHDACMELGVKKLVITHSARKASTGSRRAARWAGHTPASNPIRTASNCDARA